MSVAIRQARASDYARVVPELNAWWGGRDMGRLVPPVFFVHFEGTSFVAETEEGELTGFLCGFLSQTDPDEAYIHVLGVAPAFRGGGLGRELYERFFAAAEQNGRTVVRCVCRPENAEAIAFNQSLGFEIERTVSDYAGPGEHRLLLVKRLAA
jgi:ribosomal protein S18 acetylase RimI-like enzyme